ncbi:MAG: hypothetical protein P4L27_03720 [Ignavibacteriaceae bacterium]|nr:hypothetical protein [Ignavibacteriaceae bacterium]
MKKSLIFLSAVIVFAFIYFLVFYTITVKNTGSIISETGNFDQPSNALKFKLSMKQIDSLTSNENLRFTVKNYFQDIAHLNAVADKTKKI